MFDVVNPKMILTICILLHSVDHGESFFNKIIDFFHGILNLMDVPNYEQDFYDLNKAIVGEYQSMKKYDSIFSS